LKIDNFTPSTDLQSTHIEKTQQTESIRPQRANRSSAAQDSASISSLAQQIAQRLETESPERTARVAEAQQLYQSGSLNVPASELADSLIRSAVADTALFIKISGPSAGA
jgi:flagellar biosynthesis anti-sigma factor FlgM